MALSAAQLPALKAAIEADAVLNALPNTPDGNFTIAAAFNQLATPTFRVWLPSVSTDEIMSNGFGWDRVDNLTVGKARIWEWMTQLGRISPERANVRAGINACFSTAADQATRQAIYDHCYRSATRAEKLYATGTGAVPTDLGVGPGTLSWAGLVTHTDVESARSLP